MGRSFIDIGARGGLLSTLPHQTNRLSILTLFNEFKFYLFEPDQSIKLDFFSGIAKSELIHRAITIDSEACQLYITKDPFKSSILEPDTEALQRHFGGDASDYSVVQELSVQGSPASTLLEQYAPSGEVWIKIDAQGIEGNILESIDLDRVSVVIVELSAIQQYKEQITSDQTISLLLSSGFDLYFSNYKPSAPYENDFIFIRSKKLSRSDLVNLHIITSRYAAAFKVSKKLGEKAKICTWVLLNNVFSIATFVKSFIRQIFRGQ